MTSKKYATYFKKQCKSIQNISLEPIFGEYIITQHNQRIGVLYQDQFYLLSNSNLKQYLPDSKEVNPFEWAYYRLVLIEDTEDIELLKHLISITYKNLYFQKEYVLDISEIIKAYSVYPDSIQNIYDLYITFLRFSYEKKLLKLNPLDKQNRILHMRFINHDLTELGTQIFSDLNFKWLEYTDKNDTKTPERIVNVKMLEKYYQQLLIQHNIPSSST